MEGEIPNFVMVWTLVVASLTYCHTIGNLTSPGKTRLLLVLPVVLFFFYLPLHLTTIILGGPSSFFLAWLANFKLLLFAFGRGPLAASEDTPPSPPLHHFISLACLPIKFRTGGSPEKGESFVKGQKSALNYAIKALIFATILPTFLNKESIHPRVYFFLFAIYVYTGLELILALVAAAARVCLKVDFEQQFDEPYLSTSLQDFWGRRWNIMVTTILHPTVYEPVVKISGRWIRREWAPLPAVLATFLVSAVMHEVVFYNIGRTRPTWELTCFFVLHGMCVAIEIRVKKAFRGSKWRLPAAVSGLLATTFVAATAMWLFFPALIGRCHADVMAYREYIAFVEFMKNVGQYLKVNNFLSIVST